MITKYHHAVLTTINQVWDGTDWGKVAARYALDLYDFLGGEPDLKKITSMDLDRWVLKLSQEGASPSTINRRLAAVSKVFTTARQRGYTGPVPYFPRKKEPAHQVRWLSRDEESAMARKLIVSYGGAWEMFTILIDTGMRLGEISRLQMADVNWDTNMITIRQSKSGKPRSVPMTTRVRGILDADNPKLPLVLTQPQFRNYWEKARKVMGLAADPAFTPHVLRHTYASRLVQAGVPLKVIQELLGHSDIKMTLRYAHLAPASFDVALTALEEYNDA